MTTPTTIIQAALRHLGVLGSTETVSGDDAAKCLESLVSILDALQVEPSSIVGLQQLTYTPPLGTQSFTIGPSGNVVATQPVKIERNSFYRANGVDTHLNVRSMDDYNAMPDKAGTGSPLFVAMNRGYDTATVYVYPAADGVSQLRLWVQLEPVTSFSSITLTTDLALPAGMRRMLEWNLADEVSTDYEVSGQTLQQVKQNAANSKRLFKRSNTRIGRLNLPYGMAAASLYDINVE